MLWSWGRDHREMAARTGAAVEEPARLRVVLSVEFERVGRVAPSEEHVLDLPPSAPAMLVEVPQVQSIPLHCSDLHVQHRNRASWRGQVDYVGIAFDGPEGHPGTARHQELFRGRGQSTPEHMATE